MNISPAALWAALGFLLLIVEILTLSFVVFFFGVAALIVAIIKWTTGLSNLAVELLLFAGIGAGCLFFFRNKLKQALLRSKGVNSDAATIIETTQDIDPGKTAKIEYQGTVWDAYNESPTPIQKGNKILIIRTEGIKLVVRPHP